MNDRDSGRPASDGRVDWNVYVPQDTAVLCFLLTVSHVLLIHKKRGLGAGKINGPGGKREKNETLRETAVRETTEETGLIPDNPDHHGRIRFAFTDGYNLEVHLFTATSWSGTLTETEEAVPFWSHRSEIPYDRMWEDDRYWLPAIIDGNRVEAEMVFDGERMVFWDIRMSDGRRSRGAASNAEDAISRHEERPHATMSPARRAPARAADATARDDGASRPAPSPAECAVQSAGTPVASAHTQREVTPAPHPPTGRE